MKNNKRFYRTIFTENEQQKEEMIVPEGKITITENGTDIDVAQYATADVNVSAPAPAVNTTKLTLTISVGSDSDVYITGLDENKMPVVHHVTSSKTVEVYLFENGIGYTGVVIMTRNGTEIIVNNLSNNLSYRSAGPNVGGYFDITSSATIGFANVILSND